MSLSKSIRKDVVVHFVNPIEHHARGFQGDAVAYTETLCYHSAVTFGRDGFYIIQVGDGPIGGPGDIHTIKIPLCNIGYIDEVQAMGGKGEVEA